MRDYGIVSPKFWIGKTGKELRGNPPAQVLALYLMTSPHANMIGVFHCPLLYMAHETGLGMEGASKALRSLIEAEFCSFEEVTDTVFVHRMASFQIGESLHTADKRVKGVEREWGNIPSASIKAKFHAIYSEAFHLPVLKKNARGFQAPSKPHRSQDQDQDQDQKRDSVPIGTAAAAGDGDRELSKTELWDAGKSLLSAQGMPARQCGSFVGKLVKDYGDAVVIDAVRTAVVQRPADAAEYLIATCRSRSKAIPESVKAMTEPVPKWATKAGFGDRFEANNAGCFEKNAHQFRDGQRIEVAA